MPALRRARHLVRWMLAWFVLSLGVAAASPLVQPQAIDIVCSAAGQLKTGLLTDDGAVELGGAQLDCALCLAASAPPPAPFVAPRPPRLPAPAWATAGAPPLPLAAAWRWHARGPPAST